MLRDMRIVLMTPDLRGRSGWSRYALDLGRALAQRGHELHCIVCDASGEPWCKEYAVLRPPTSYLGSTLLCFFHALKTKRLLKRIKPDIVHIIAEPYALMFPFMRRGPWKEVLTIHGTYSVVPLLMSRKIRMLAERYYRRMDRVIAVSTFTKNYLKRRIPELADVADRATVIHNAISLDGIDADTAPRPADRTFSIVSVSGVKRKKGYLQSVRAIRQFLDVHPVKITYDIVGNDTIDAAFTRELKAEIATLDLTEIVRFRGSVTDAELDGLYRAADLFLLPSLQEDDYFEGFGLVFIEANARGTPAIGGNTGGCPEAIQEEVSGYVCDPEDTAALSARIEDVLIKNAIDRGACRSWAEKHDIDTTASTIEAVYARR